MAKSKNEASFMSSLMDVGLYKRNQGRMTRQITAAALALVVLYGSWTLSQGPLAGVDFASESQRTEQLMESSVRIGIPALLSLIGLWIIYRVVNYPRFADFLISVEAEMDKVSWASRDELIRATAVVLVTMLFLGFVLLAFDVFWQWFFELIGFLRLE